MNILILLPLIAAAVMATPAYPHTPAGTYLVNFPGPVAYGPEPRNIPGIVGSATTATQSVATWQLKQLRRKWIFIICMLNAECPTIAYPDKHPWAPARNYPIRFRIDDLDEEMQHREIFSPNQFVADDRVDAVITDALTDVTNIRGGAGSKATNKLVGLAEFQLSQWIWRWNIILCFVNPSCPHVNIPPGARAGRHHPPIHVNVAKMRILAELQGQPRVMFPVSFARD